MIDVCKVILEGSWAVIRVLGIMISGTEVWDMNATMRDVKGTAEDEANFAEEADNASMAMKHPPRDAPEGGIVHYRSKGLQMYRV